MTCLRRAPLWMVLGPILLSIGWAAPTRGEPAQGWPANVEQVESLGGITEYRLKSNGMPILLAPNHTAPVISFMVVYHVGSRNEAPGNTGSAHLLEHLLFNKSTENFGRAKGHTTFQQILYEAGADFSSTNMTTWYDRMTGYSTLPSDKLELAIRIEADRLGRALLLDEERQTEMTVVRNEYEISENDPSSVLFKAVIGAAIVAHPYHWDTLGYRSDIEGVSIEKLREHYKTYFWPDNATAILVGDFDPAVALALFDREFGGFPRAPHPIPSVITVEPPQEGERRVVVQRPGEIGLVELAYIRPGSMHPDFIPLDVLATILGDGVNARLNQALVETGLASRVSAYNWTLRDPYPLLCEATLAPGSTHEQVEEAMKAAIERVGREGVTEQELARAKKQIEVIVVRSRDGAYPLTSSLGEAVASADWKWFVGYLDAVKRVTAEDVRRVAATYLVGDRATVGWFVPIGAAEAQASGPAQAVAATPATTPATPAGPAALSAPSAESGGDRPAAAETTEAGAAREAGRPFAARTLRTVLPNGIVLDIVENHAVPTVALRGSFAAGRMTAPASEQAVPELTAMMVSRGTKTRDKRAIAALMDGAGARLTFMTSLFETSVTGSCLAADLPLLLDVMAEEILSPAFPDSELTKARSEMTTEVLQAAEDTYQRALDRALQLIFPEGHPYRPVDPEGMIRSIEGTKRGQIEAFHRNRYVGSTFRMAIVGDMDAKKVTDLVVQRFGALAAGEPPRLDAPPVRLGAATRAEVQMPGKANMNLLLGHASELKRTDPDFEAAILGNAALGQNDMSSRIGRRVRDIEGLSYALGSRFFAADVLEGAWMVTVFVAPENLAKAERSTREEIEKYCKEGITEAELEEQKSFFAGNYKVRLGSNAGVAAALVEAERFDFGPSYLDEFPSRIRAVTREQANAAVHEHLHPAAMHAVVAGDPVAAPE